MLLLSPGGHQVYFGPLGHHSAAFVDYLHAIPGVPRLPPGTNPASWMLTVLEGSHAAQSDGGNGNGDGGRADAGNGGRADAGNGSNGDGGSSGPLLAPASLPAAPARTPRCLFARRRAGAPTAAATSSSGGGAVRVGAPGALLRYPPPETVPPSARHALFPAMYFHSQLAVLNAERVERYLGGSAAGAAAAAGGAGSEAQAQAGAAAAAPTPSAAGEAAIATTAVTVVAPLATTSAPPPAVTTSAAAGSTTVKQAATPPMVPLAARSRYAVPFAVQAAEVFRRANVAYWRNAEENFVSGARACGCAVADAVASYCRHAYQLVHHHPLRVPPPVQVRLVVLLYLGLLFGLLYLRVDYATFAGVQSGLGFVLGATAWASIIFFTTGVTRHFAERDVFYRERAAGFYHAEAFSLSQLVVELPYLALFVRRRPGGGVGGGEAQAWEWLLPQGANTTHPDSRFRPSMSPPAGAAQHLHLLLGGGHALQRGVVLLLL